MPLPLYIVDAFSDRPFTGNPAAICLLAQVAEADWMQAVAAEMNLSETAFLVPRAPAEWDLRWFTPTTEVRLCGHATLAAAHVVWQRGATVDALTFHTLSGPLVTRRDNGAIAMDFPADRPEPVDPPAGLLDALGGAATYVGRGRDDLLVAVDDAATVHALAPDMHALAAIDTRGVMVTAPGDTPGDDFVSRFFAPRAGIPEDPVTGSAHCVLGPYWAERLNKDEVRGFQASKRGGRVTVRTAGERVTLTGHATTTVSGELHDDR